MGTTTDAMWAAVVGQDANADGQFFYSVRTTGVYCRPSCGARRPRRDNVEFHPSCAAAEEAGYRPCKRCQPRGNPLAVRRAALVEQACRLIEDSDEAPTLAMLAKSVGLSQHHFHRVFKTATGVTPKAYAVAVRSSRMRANLSRGGSVTDAIYRAGFGSSSRFYASSQERLGMAPSEVRGGGGDRRIRFAVGDCSLGTIAVAASDIGICAISLGDEPATLVRELQDQFFNADLVGDDPEFDRWVAQVVGFVEAPQIGLDLPLDIRGTAFQQRVWQALTKIPVGSTATYSEVAASIGAPTASRAVAQACASNRIAVAIPCHRVIRQDGSLSGYRWGVERKSALLTNERNQSP